MKTAFKNIFCLLFIFYHSSVCSFYFNEFENYPKNGHHVFPYNSQSACIVKTFGRGIYARLASPYSFERTALTLAVDNITNLNSVQILNCFEYQGYGFIIWKPYNDDYIHFIRGHHSLNFKFTKIIKNIYYDHFTNLIYFHAADTDEYFYLFNMYEFQNFWKHENYSHYLTSTYRNLSLSSYYHPFKKNDYLLSQSFSDLMIVNNSIYYIHNLNVYVRTFFSDYTQALNTTQSPLFEFIPFPKIHLHGSSTSTKRSLADLLTPTGGVTECIPFPPPPDIHNNGTLSYFVYVLTFALFAVIIFLLRMMFNGGNVAFSTRGFGSSLMLRQQNPTHREGRRAHNVEMVDIIRPA